MDARTVNPAFDSLVQAMRDISNETQRVKYISINRTGFEAIEKSGIWSGASAAEVSNKVHSTVEDFFRARQGGSFSESEVDQLKDIDKGLHVLVDRMRAKIDEAGEATAKTLILEKAALDIAATCLIVEEKLRTTPVIKEETLQQEREARMKGVQDEYDQAKMELDAAENILRDCETLEKEIGGIKESVWNEIQASEQEMNQAEEGSILRQEKAQLLEGKRRELRQLNIRHNNERKRHKDAEFQVYDAAERFDAANRKAIRFLDPNIYMNNYLRPIRLEFEIGADGYFRKDGVSLGIKQDEVEEEIRQAVGYFRNNPNKTEAVRVKELGNYKVTITREGTNIRCAIKVSEKALQREAVQNEYDQAKSELKSAVQNERSLNSKLKDDLSPQILKLQAELRALEQEKDGVGEGTSLRAEKEKEWEKKVAGLQSCHREWFATNRLWKKAKDRVTDAHSRLSLANADASRVLDPDVYTDIYVRGMLGHYQPGPDGYLMRDGVSSGFKQSEVEGVVRLAVDRFQRNPDVRKFATPVGGYKVLVIRTGTNIQLKVLSKKLGDGSFGVVHKTIDPATGKTDAYKEARTVKPEHLAMAQADIRQERAILKKVWNNALRVPIGVMRPPHSMVCMVPEGNAPGQSGSVGILTHFYDRGELLGRIKDRAKTLSSPGIDASVKKQAEEDSFMEVYQELSGLAFLADQNLVHGDLKPRNCLCEAGPGGLPVTVLADFGGARIFDRSKESIPRTNTPGYIFLDDQIRKKELLDGPWTESDQNEAAALLPKMDVFALGCIIFETFNGFPPFHPGYMGFREESKRYKGRNNIPAGLQPLVRRMLDKNPDVRPTAQEAFRLYDEFLRDHDINLYADMQTKLDEYRRSIAEA